MDKLRSIDYFMKVAEAKSIVAAANVLEVSPSAVSRVIAGFESKLGFSLFHRTTRRLSLTADGETFLERCRQILQELEEAETEGRQKRAMHRTGSEPHRRRHFQGRPAHYETELQRGLSPRLCSASTRRHVVGLRIAAHHSGFCPAVPSRERSDRSLSSLGTTNLRRR